MDPSSLLHRTVKGLLPKEDRMPISDHRRWCLEQAIEIIKLAPADSLPTHERLKRVYKRLVTLSEDSAPITESQSPKDPKVAKKH
jgi:ribosomal protein L13